LINSPAQDLQSSRNRVGVDPLGFGCLSLQDDLRAAPKVQT
jgi:hypothetical protein